jgi:hypothetical protein
MAKQETIKHLTDLMATVQMAHFKGREVGVRVHESPQVSSAAISIDLYHFEGDGKPVCDGLTFQRECDKYPIRAYCIAYNPDLDWETGHLYILCCDDDGGVSDDLDLIPELVSEEVLTAITKWLEKAMVPTKPKSNDVTSFFYYMWNKWNEEECKAVFNDPHFWNKWCEAYDTMHGPRGAAELFYMMLSDTNRDKLVARALECYDGMTEK